MLIRPATLADLPRLLEMVDAIAALHEALDVERFARRPGLVESYRGWLAARTADDRAVLLVADRGDGTSPHVVGFVIATIERNIQIYTPAEYGWVHDLYVEPAYRNEGIGRQLAMETVARFASLGVTQVRLETAAANDAARGLFERCGFRACAVEMLRAIV